MSKDATIDPQEFRKTLGCFTTGVTVITTRTGEGEPVGITANSFNSVSLNPPLVLWSLAKSARSLAAFDTSARWAVHILSAEQEHISNRFARAGEDKFSGIEIDAGEGDVPLLRHCTARLQCKTTFKYDGGDHVIFVGEVTDFSREDHAPLVYQGGKYAVATYKSPQLSLTQGAGQKSPGTGFDEDFLGYLLGRAQFDFTARLSEPLRRHGITDLERYVLFALVTGVERTIADLADLLSLTGHEITVETVSALSARGLVNIEGEGAGAKCSLTQTGQEVVLEVISASKAIESEILDQFGFGNAVALKSLLKQFIVQMDSGVPHPWESKAAAAPTQHH